MVGLKGTKTFFFSGADFGFDSKMSDRVSMPSTWKPSSQILNFPVRNDNNSYALAA